MAENGCQYHTDHHHRIEKLEERTEELDDRLTNVDKSTGIMLERISISLESLSRLPEAIDALKETNNKMENKIDNVGQQVNNLRTEVGHEIGSIKGRLTNAEKNISTIDSEGHINFRQWLKLNAFKIVFAVAVVIAAVGIWVDTVVY
ncbi:MAG: hypothetical protein RR198_05795 [Oscillospiraceae bacterium]